MVGLVEDVGQRAEDLAGRVKDVGSQGQELADALRKFGTEATGIEAKAAEGGLPKSVRETLSAFSNSPNGGSLILGLDEADNFRAVGLSDARKLQSDLVAMCRDDLAPPLRPIVSVEEVDGAAVVVAEVPELSRGEKPCYVRDRGLERGSYVRVGESDRRLTSEEVQQLVADRGQPVFDLEPVPGATLADLDPAALRSYLERLRTAKARLFADEPDSVVLRMTRVCLQVPDGPDAVTLAALLALGRYPQQFLPQLNMTFVHYPTTTGEATASGVRFLDNVSIEGSIPLMVREALTIVQRNMSRRALLSGGGRRDMWEYPPEALREAIVNALVHRDLSPGSRGTQVQIELYPDRLRVTNPGGLFGSIDINRLGEEGRSSARNALLMKLLEDVVVPGEDRTVAENRGSGIRAMRAALRRAGMSDPALRDRITSFEVLMPNHTLLDDGTVAWLAQIGREGLRDTQCIALALLRRGEMLDNSRYRAATGVGDSRAATWELQDLVARELVEQTGTRGGARYTLSDYAMGIGGETRARVRPNRRRQIVDLIALHGELSKAQISELLNINPKTTEHWLGGLKRAGLIEPTTANPRDPNTRYRVGNQGTLPYSER